MYHIGNWKIKDSQKKNVYVNINIYINIKKTQVYNIHTGPRALKNTFQNHRQEKHLDRDFSSLVVDLERFPIVSNKEL